MTTIDYFKNHPLRVAKDQSMLPVSTVIQACSDTALNEMISPIMGAYIHYGGVELADMLTIHQPDLTDEQAAYLAKHWYASCGIITKQLLFYLWRIISKEMRHGTTTHCEKAFASGNHNPLAVAAVKDICTVGEYQETLKKHGDCPVGDYVSAIEHHYRYGGWGGAFGGKKWADIALVFKRYIYGEISAMIAADRAWTLVHNTGPIFNKGFYFKNQNPIKVLNAQATGSVFSLDWLDTVEGNYHETIGPAFIKFRDGATTALQTVKPDYAPGVDAKGGLVLGNSEGEDEDSPTGLTTFGGYSYTTKEREKA